MDRLFGWKIKKMEQEDLGKSMIMVKQKVFFESIIVTPKSAMLIVLIRIFLRLDG